MRAPRVVSASSPADSSRTAARFAVGAPDGLLGLGVMPHTDNHPRAIRSRQAPVIEGVRVRGLVRHADERGSLTEVWRSDWPEFLKFGQASLTVNLPGVVRGWHWHRRQTDVIVVVQGRAVVALYDARTRSPTRGGVMEFTCDESALRAIVVPPGVYHGYKTLGERPALILNFPDRGYDASSPDEERVPFDSSDVPYDWSAAR